MKSATTEIRERIHTYLHHKEGVMQVRVKNNGDVIARVSWTRGDGGPRPWWVLVGNVHSVNDTAIAAGY